MKHNILKYTESVVQHVRLLECNKLSNETEYFQICSQNILETSEFLTKLDIKWNWHLILEKIAVAFEFLLERNIFVCINFHDNIIFMLSNNALFCCNLI